MAAAVEHILGTDVLQIISPRNDVAGTMVGNVPTP